MIWKLWSWPKKDIQRSNFKKSCKQKKRVIMNLRIISQRDRNILKLWMKKLQLSKHWKRVSRKVKVWLKLIILFKNKKNLKKSKEKKRPNKKKKLNNVRNLKRLLSKDSLKNQNKERKRKRKQSKNLRQIQSWNKTTKISKQSFKSKKNKARKRWKNLKICLNNN